MATSAWQSFRKTDAAVISSFENIESALGTTSSQLQIRLTEGHHHIVGTALAEARSNPIVASLVSAGQSLALQLTLTLKVAGHSVSVNVRRPSKTGADDLSIDQPDQLPPDLIIKFMMAASTEFPTYARAESIDRLLGDELAEFYRAREAGLLRLENLNQSLITGTDKYRQQLDERFDAKNAELENRLTARQAELQATSAAEREALVARERELEALQKSLDDRASRHARRALRVDLQNALNERSRDFRLTRGTGAKRLAVHALYALMLVLLVVLLGFEVRGSNAAPDVTSFIRLGLTFATTLATFILYIRWSDQWFRQHADEEFRLKRMSLDVDRASWVVETAMEWQQQNNGPIPAQLLEQLSRGLFSAGPQSGPVRHPVEDLGAAVLAASTRLKVNLPGVGEATLDRKGVEQLQGAMSDGTAR